MPVSKIVSNLQKLLTPRHALLRHLTLKSDDCPSSNKEGKKNKKDLVLINLDTEDEDRIQKLKESTIEMEGPTTLTVLEDIPLDQLQSRRARIFQPPKNAAQSGTHNLNCWMIDFDNQQRWENPLMSWCSNADPLSNLKLKFCTKEEAVEYCDKYGWKWYVSGSNLSKKFKAKSYGNNFVDKRCRVSTK